MGIGMAIDVLIASSESSSSAISRINMRINESSPVLSSRPFCDTERAGCDKEGRRCFHAAASGGAACDTGSF